MGEPMVDIGSQLKLTETISRSRMVMVMQYLLQLSGTTDRKNSNKRDGFGESIFVHVTGISEAG